MLTEVKEYVDISSDKCIETQQDEMLKLMKDALKNLVSKKKKLPIKFKSTRYYNSSENQLVIGSYGFGIEGYSRASKIDTLEDIIGILKMDTKFSNYVWKERKKQILDALQKHLVDWKFYSTSDINKDVKINTRVKYLSDDYITMFKEHSDKEIDMDLISHGRKINVGQYYSDVVTLVDFNNDITPYNCFLMYQIWDDVKAPLKESLNKLKEIYNHNTEVQRTVIDSIGHLIVAEGL